MKHQRGMTLIIALILLLIMTLGGLGLINGAKLQQTIVNSYEEKEVVFQAAEEALRTVERTFVEDTSYTTANFLDSCTSANPNCFVDDCNSAGIQGLCRTVNYPTASNISNCETQGVRVWEDSTKWANAGTLTVNVKRPADATGSVLTLSMQAEYLIEFRCYVQKVESPVIAFGTFTASEWSEYYRITVKVDGIDVGGNTRQSPVMLQSTFRKN